MVNYNYMLPPYNMGFPYPQATNAQTPAAGLNFPNQPLPNFPQQVENRNIFNIYHRREEFVMGSLSQQHGNNQHFFNSQQPFQHNSFRHIDPKLVKSPMHHNSYFVKFST